MQLSIEHGEGSGKRFSRFGDQKDPYRRVISAEYHADTCTLLVLYSDGRPSHEPQVQEFNLVQSFSMASGCLHGI